MILVGLTALEAFRSMVVFLEKYFDQTHSEDVGALLGDMMLFDDGTTADPAAWHDWIAAVKRVNPDSGDTHILLARSFQIIGCEDMKSAKDTQSWLDSLMLHDVAVRHVTCDYGQHQVLINLERHASGEQLHAELAFDGVVYAGMSFYEPWGAGIYIEEVAVNAEKPALERLVSFGPAREDYLQVTILLNSGDAICVVASSIAYRTR